ncbi:hypothetical protein [Desertibaculum subflavum]|uniref:hypothetical protein n=1 Tax=Desertibaculum subflavum TaxID=2268458 RepID=UPI000E6603A8
MPAEVDNHDEVPGAAPAELAAFGWTAIEGGGFIAGRLRAAPAGQGWIVVEHATGHRLAELPTVSAVRRFAAKAEAVEDLAATAPRLATATLEEELKLSREAVAALERAVADLEEQINDLMAKDLLFAEDR